MSSLRPSLRRLGWRMAKKWTYARDRVAAVVHRNGVVAHWAWSGHSVNFGDLITPLLIRRFGCTPLYARARCSRLIATGSLLERIGDEYDGIILGTGFIQAESRRAFPRATVLAVRGALTRDHIGRGSETPLGDPGLLADRLLPCRQEKRFELGIVPHYHDKGPRWGRLIARLGPAARIIDVQRQPLAVLREIDQCRHILSSSLHGLITADALGIPTGWLCADGLIGGRFKFDDYYSSLDLECAGIVLRGDESLSELLAQTSLKPAPRIAAMKETLWDLWRRALHHMNSPPPQAVDADRRWK